MCQYYWTSLVVYNPQGGKLWNFFLLFQMQICKRHLVPGQWLQTPDTEDSVLRRAERDPYLSVGDCGRPDCIHTAEQTQANTVSSTLKYLLLVYNMKG